MTPVRFAVVVAAVFVGLPVVVTFAYYGWALLGPGEKFVTHEYAWGRTTTTVGIWNDVGPFDSLVIEHPAKFPARIRFREDLAPVLLSEVTTEYVERHGVGSILRPLPCRFACPVHRGYSCYGMFYNAEGCFWRDKSLDHLTIGAPSSGAALEFFVAAGGNGKALPFSSNDLRALFGAPVKRIEHRRNADIADFAH